MKSFSSDNYSSVCKEVMEAIIACNKDHAPSYGNDKYTEIAIQLLKENFGKQIKVYFVANGTAANILALKAITRSHHAILTAESSHILAHEVGAVFANIGAAIFPIPQLNGKITHESIEEAFIKASYWGSHNNKPKVVSVSQATEFGTVYTKDELKNISSVCKKFQLLLHMDGCRLSNAAAGLNTSLKALTNDVGVDVLSFGGTKNGLMFGEAIIFFNPELADEFEYIQKQELQLLSKLRYLSVQFIPYLQDKIWHRNAQHANQMCERLCKGLLKNSDIKLLCPVQTNQIFAYFPKQVIDKTQAIFPYHLWDDKKNIVRLVTSFDTSATDVDAFLKIVENSI